MKNILKTFAVALVALAGHAQADSLALGTSADGNPLAPEGFGIRPYTEGDPCSGFSKGDIGMTSAGLILSCQSGRWQFSGGVAGKYSRIGSFNGSASFKNGSRPVLIQATGGGKGNRHDLRGYVDGTQVVRSHNNNSSWNKGTSITFGAPAGSNVRITSSPYGQGSASFTVYSFEL